MKATNFPFTVQRRDDQTLVAMDCGGVIRARVMPPDLLRAIVDTCQKIHNDVIPGVERNRRFRLRIPRFPDCIPVAQGDIDGVCTLRLVASADGDGAIKYCAGFYDAEDDTAPSPGACEQPNRRIHRRRRSRPPVVSIVYRQHCWVTRPFSYAYSGQPSSPILLKGTDQ